MLLKGNIFPDCVVGGIFYKNMKHLSKKNLKIPFESKLCKGINKLDFNKKFS